MIHPSYTSFPVSDDVLFEIWNNRPDLQKHYPEVKEGDFRGIKKWAELSGWRENPKLSALIPEGQTPDYEKPPWMKILLPKGGGNEKFFPYIIIGISLGVGIIVTVLLLNTSMNRRD